MFNAGTNHKNLVKYNFNAFFKYKFYTYHFFEHFNTRKLPHWDFCEHF